MVESMQLPQPLPVNNGTGGNLVNHLQLVQYQEQQELVLEC